jgi:hypothetical protein
MGFAGLMTHLGTLGPSGFQGDDGGRQLPEEGDHLRGAD